MKCPFIFEDVQGCVIVQVVQTLPLEILYPLKGPHQVFTVSVYYIMLTFNRKRNAKKRLSESQFETRISHNKHVKQIVITASSYVSAKGLVWKLVVYTCVQKVKKRGRLLIPTVVHVE